jgi:hypothetical protein
MAKKKRSKSKKVSGRGKKSIRHRAVQAVKQHTQESISALKSPVRANRIGIVVKNLVIFGALFLVSVIVAMLSSNELVDQLFWLLAMLTAFVGVACLVVLLIIFFMKAMKK